MSSTLTSDRTQKQSRFALRFFVVSLVVFAGAGSLAALLIKLVGHNSLEQVRHFPTAFAWSTFLLVLGSIYLQKGIAHVQIEQQRSFRRTLRITLVAGMLFVSVQSYGLWCLLQTRIPSEAQTGVNAFVFVFATLHGMHFVVALMFLVFVTLKAFNDRYDHEYYGGVTICAWFWHFLAVVWFCILAVLAIAAL